MLGRGHGCRVTHAQGVEQEDREPEPQQAPQYLVDLIAPLAARMTAIEEQLAAQVRQEPSVHVEAPVQESSIREKILERAPVVPPTPPVEDEAADQEAWLRLVERYQKLKAPEFHGSTDSIATHKWKEDVSNILDMLNVNTVQKQSLAAFTLKGDAGGWYRLRFTPEQRMTVSWETFIYLFDEQ